MMKVSDQDRGKRLDAYLAEVVGDLTRSRIQQLIAQGEVRVNGGEVRSNYKLKENDSAPEQPSAPPPPQEDLSEANNKLNALLNGKRDS